MQHEKGLNWLKLGVGTALAVGGAAVVGLYAGMRYLLRRREPDRNNPPTNYHLSYQDITFPSRDGVVLAGWWIPAPAGRDQAHGTVIICSGLEGSKDGDTEQALPLHHAHFNVLMFDWRGHGRSEGARVTLGAQEVHDLLGAVAYLESHFGINQVGILGFSMGAAVALMAAEQTEQIITVIADSPYLDLDDLLHHYVGHYVGKRGIPRSLQGLFVNAFRIVAELSGSLPQSESSPRVAASRLGTRPVYFIYSAADPYVDLNDVHVMVAKVRGPCNVWISDTVGHRSTCRADPDRYQQQIVAWFRAYLIPEPLRTI